MASISIDLLHEIYVDCGGSAVLVFLVLDDYANKDRIAWPKASTIAHDVGFGVRSVRESLRRLRSRGFIAQHQRRKSGVIEWVVPKSSHCGASSKRPRDVKKDSGGGIDKVKNNIQPTQNPSQHAESIRGGVQKASGGVCEKLPGGCAESDTTLTLRTIPLNHPIEPSLKKKPTDVKYSAETAKTSETDNSAKRKHPLAFLIPEWRLVALESWARKRREAAAKKNEAPKEDPTPSEPAESSTPPIPSTPTTPSEPSKPSKHSDPAHQPSVIGEEKSQAWQELLDITPINHAGFRSYILSLTVEAIRRLADMVRWYKANRPNDDPISLAKWKWQNGEDVWTAEYLEQDEQRRDPPPTIGPGHPDWGAHGNYPGDEAMADVERRPWGSPPPKDYADQPHGPCPADDDDSPCGEYDDRADECFDQDHHPDDDIRDDCDYDHRTAAQSETVAGILDRFLDRKTG